MGEEYGKKMLMLIDYITDSLMLDTPMIADDPAYQQLEGKIPSIINMALLSMNEEDVESLTNEQLHCVVLKCLHTLYLRLAVAVAPEFEGSAEQVTFKKGQRFAHYSTLADKVKKELDETYVDDIKFADVKIVARNGTRRNYNLGEEQPVMFCGNGITTNSVELTWGKFNTSYGSFDRYILMYDTEPIYDEYSVPKLKVIPNQTVVREFFDIHRTKFRLTGLSPETHYYIVLILKGKDGVKSFTTLEIVTETLDEGQGGQP